VGGDLLQILAVDQLRLTQETGWDAPVAVDGDLEERNDTERYSAVDSRWDVDPPPTPPRQQARVPLTWLLKVMRATRTSGCW